MPETFAYSVAEGHALETLRTAFASPIAFTDTAAPPTATARASAGSGSCCASLGPPPGHVLATKADRDLHSGDFSGDQMRAR